MEPFGDLLPSPSVPSRPKPTSTSPQASCVQTLLLEDADAGAADDQGADAAFLAAELEAEAEPAVAIAQVAEAAEGAISPASSAAAASVALVAACISAAVAYQCHGCVP